MRITISNTAQIPKKYLRYIKWKFYTIKNKFPQLNYAEVFLKSEGQSPKMFIANFRLGLAGDLITVQNKSENLNEVFRKSSNAIHRHLAKSSAPRTRKKRY